jgi:hypothetical protein
VLKKAKFDDILFRPKEYFVSNENKEYFRDMIGDKNNQKFKFYCDSLLNKNIRGDPDFEFLVPSPL